jgi:hypothetical protein
MRPHINRLFETAREFFEPANEPLPAWYESASVCALADSERHLGHAAKVGKHWIAYDAIHLNPSNDGFRVIGTFETIAAAKEAIESSVRFSWVRAMAGVTVEREAEPAARLVRFKRV